MPYFCEAMACRGYHPTIGMVPYFYFYDAISSLSAALSPPLPCPDPWTDAR